jgi:hypothetical protein
MRSASFSAGDELFKGERRFGNGSHAARLKCWRGAIDTNGPRRQRAAVRGLRLRPRLTAKPLDVERRRRVRPPIRPPLSRSIRRCGRAPPQAVERGLADLLLRDDQRRAQRDAGRRDGARSDLASEADFFRGDDPLHRIGASTLSSDVSSPPMRPMPPVLADSGGRRARRGRWEQPPLDPRPAGGRRARDLADSPSARRRT